MQQKSFPEDNEKTLLAALKATADIDAAASEIVISFVLFVAFVVKIRFL